MVSHDSGGFWETLQRSEVAACIVVDDLDVAPRRMRDEDPASLRIERAMIEVAVETVRDCDDASWLQGHFKPPVSRQCGRVEGLDRPLRGLPCVVSTGHVTGIKAGFAQRCGRLASDVKSVDAEGDDRFLLRDFAD